MQSTRLLRILSAPLQVLFKAQVDVAIISGNIVRMHDTYAPKKYPMEFVTDIWAAISGVFEKPCVVHLEGTLSDPRCQPFMCAPSVSAEHTEVFSGSTVARVAFATGDYLINENSAEHISSRTFISQEFPDSFEQFKLLEAELLYDMNYTSVAVKGSEASDV